MLKLKWAMNLRANVRFGSICDMAAVSGHVRFTPKADIRRVGCDVGYRIKTALCCVDQRLGRNALRDLTRKRPLLLDYARARILLTVIACHCPPRAVSMPRALSVSATSREFEPHAPRCADHHTLSSAMC